MLFTSRMDRHPRDLDPERRAEIIGEEKARAWAAAFRCMAAPGGSSASTPTSASSMSAPATTAHLLLSSLPLFPYATIKVTPLATVPRT
ncbi:muconolactone delta-isomerase [Pseudonocardia sp. MCCB 268]|nr:muconolactone delta-isomerase [Pseudonocardia cytotoxica]